jgi:type 1 glutamine amidotransferase
MKRALLFFGGWAGHQPRECADFFAGKLAGRGFSPELSDSLSCLDDRKFLDAFDLIVPLWTMGSISERQELNLVGAVQAGVGLGGFHGGMGDAFRGSIGYQWMVGGQFVAHPDNCKEYMVNLVKPADPIVAGLADFRVRSEQYYMLVDPLNEVLASTVFISKSAPWIDGITVPVVWKKLHGAGRVFYSALGHELGEFMDVPEQLELTLRGLLWAAR